MWRAWTAEAAAWDAEQQERKDAAWEACTTPAERATKDLDRFLTHYFLTDGRPDPSKTPEPLALTGFEDRFALHDKARKIPGLETCSGGEGKTRTICIGWGYSVQALALKMNVESRRRKKEQEDALWDAAMEEHRELAAATRKQGGPKVVGLSPEPPNLQKCKGSYIIRCERVAQSYPSRDLFTLDVGFGRGPNPRVLSGALEFSFFQGTMLLALEQDRRRLDQFSGVRKRVRDKFQDADSEEEGSVEEESEEEGSEEEGSEEGHSEDDDSGEEDDEEDDTEGEDCEEVVDKHNHAQPTRKRKAPPHISSPGRPTKKIKSAAQRISILLRGRETGMGEIQPDPEAGYLEFIDELFTHFRGKVDLPYIGRAVEIEGFKIAPRAKQSAEPWDNFSEDAYEHARVARWR